VSTSRRSVAILGLAFVLAFPGVAQGQTQDAAAAAEKEKERRRKSKGTAKTYGNKDLPASERSVPAEGTPSPSPTPEGESRGAPRDETYWRNRATGLQKAVAAAEQRVAKAQADYDGARKGNLQPLPIDALSQQPPIPQVNADADRLQKELEDAKSALAQAQQALTDLEEEARKAGAPPGWLR
jgi:hypothetical protein